MRSEAITGRNFRAPDIVAPGRRSSVNVRNVAEELLVPANRAEQLRGKLVFRLQVIREGVGVAESRDFEPRFKRFRPELPVMPGEADVLGHEALVVIANVGSEGQGWPRLGAKV